MLRKTLLFISLSLLFAVSIAAQDTSTAAMSADKPAKAKTFRPSKDQIRQGQAMLKEKKLFTGEATGVYSDATRAAIKVFQKDNSLDVNGKFDQATLDKMGISASKPSESAMKTGSAQSSSTASTGSGTTKRPAPFRANAEQIRTAQKMLKDGKMYTGEQTGKLDDPTREGLKKYQEANGLKVMGSLNSATLEKMGIALTDAQKKNVEAQAAYDAAKAQPKN